jgi:ABC-type uncharacterized transport system substrate-binding protein
VMRLLLARPYAAQRLQTHILNASTSREIDAAFATLVRERADALFVAPDGFLGSRRVQCHTGGARQDSRELWSACHVEVGGLMSYGTRGADMYRRVGIYTGSILKGAKPADLPVMQSTRFEFLINLQTAKALGIDVPPMLLARTDEVIE